VCGVGHPIFDRAIEQALEFDAPTAHVRGLPAPLALFIIFDRVTDTGGHVRETLVGVKRSPGGFGLLKDWEVLLALAKAGDKNSGIETHCDDMSDAELADWLVTAKEFLLHELESLKLPYKVPSLREHALLAPSSVTT
jgi:hypothetical protein